MRKVHGYHFFLIAIVVLAVATLAISYSDGVGVELAPKRIPPVPPCIVPPVYPQLITQSGTICAGTYYDGIEIAGNNINVKCAGATFVGYSNPNRMNGLLINGSYRNIVIEDCAFLNFPEDGVLISGPSGVLNPTNLSVVTLKNVTALYNGQNGLEIRENTYQIDAVGGNYNNNLRNGVQLVSEYKDPARYNVSPDIYPKYFPNDIRVINTTISNNNENGIYIDGTKYLRQPYDFEYENNSLVFEGNIIKNNSENGIKNTDFFISSKWMIAGGLNSFNNYFIRKNLIIMNGGSGIKVNTERVYTQDVICSGLLNTKLISLSNIGYIFLNKIEQNNEFGIDVTIDGYSNVTNPPSNCLYPFFESYIDNVYANIIRYNVNSGVHYHLSKPIGEGIEGFYATNLGKGDYYLQNIINLNGGEGVHLDSPTTGRYPYQFSTYNTRNSHLTLVCNDIISNNLSGIKASKSVDYPYFNESRIDINMYDANIIELNREYGINFNFSSWISDLQSTGDYFAYNLNGQIFLGVVGYYVFNHIGGAILRADIIGNPVLALNNDPLGRINWTWNYWSDYSPTCATTGFWCNVPRPIPIADQDTLPKAGAPWGNNARGYLQLDQGVLLSQCYVEIPQYPPRPTITIVSGNPIGTVGTNTGEPGNPGSDV